MFASALIDLELRAELDGDGAQHTHLPFMPEKAMEFLCARQGAIAGPAMFVRLSLPSCADAQLKPPAAPSTLVTRLSAQGGSPKSPTRPSVGISLACLVGGMVCSLVIALSFCF